MLLGLAGALPPDDDPRRAASSSSWAAAGAWPRRGALGRASVPRSPWRSLLVYNLAVTGHVFNPAYDYIAQNEYHPPGGQYHADWAIEDLRYVPGNAVIMLALAARAAVQDAPTAPASSAPSRRGSCSTRTAPSCGPTRWA